MTAGSKISRRLLLKGLGVSIALPWLESLPVLGQWFEPATAAKTPQRFACMFIGDGISPPHWWAKGKGAEMELGPSLEPLAPFKEKINVINGLFNREGDGGHARCTGNILSGAALQRGRTIRGGVSMDQRLAKHFEEETAMPSLVLGCEQPVSGFHESQYSMVYASHISWRNPDSPVPIELYPVAGVRRPVRQQGRQAPGEHPGRRAGAGQRSARQGERLRPDEARRVSVVRARDRAAGAAAEPSARRKRRRPCRPASVRRRASRRTSASTPG